MPWPFKFFDSFSVKGRSNTKEVRQTVRKTSAPVQQAGRDIKNIKAPRIKKEIPYLFISGTSFGGNGVTANFGFQLTNASDQTLFVDHLDALGVSPDYSGIHVEPHKTVSVHPFQLEYPRTNANDKGLLYYSDSAGKKYISTHILTFDGRADERFNVSGITAQRPAKQIK